METQTASKLTIQGIEESLRATETGADRKVYEVTLKSEKYIYKIGNVTKFKCRFFVATNGLFCVQPLKNKRTGFRCELVDADIDSIKEINKEPKQYDVLKNAKTLLAKIHPNVWDELRASLKSAIEANDASMLESEYMLHGKVKYRNIANDIAKHNRWNKDEILRSIAKAFEQKTSYRWSHQTNGGGGRDLSLSVEPKEDGILRAYFSSEFMGCGNGDYYLLINPTTAIFCERD